MNFLTKKAVYLFIFCLFSGKQGNADEPIQIGSKAADVSALSESKTLSRSEIHARLTQEVEKAFGESQEIEASPIGRMLAALNGIDVMTKFGSRIEWEDFAKKNQSPQVAKAATGMVMTEEKQKEIKARKSAILKNLRDYLIQHPRTDQRAYPGPLTYDAVEKIVNAQSDGLSR